MAPPTRLRPHLNDLLQKNLELEHVVADLRHQLTQSSAKWADERKTLAVGCDTLMASFAKFRARLDVQPLDFGDSSEGEVEQNLDEGRQSEETGEADEDETKKDQNSSATGDLHDKCRALAAELRVKEEELEESRRKREVAEEELQRIQRSLDTQSEQLRAALASSKADTSNKAPPSHTPDDPSTQVNPSPSRTPPENTQEKLDHANQEITRLKQLLQEWKKYGSDWKRDGQLARVRASELHRREDDLNAKIKVAEDTNAQQDAEIQSLASALAEQTVAVEQQRTACRESEKRVRDLEALVTRLRAQLSPEQLASLDSASDRSQAAPEPSSSIQPQTETNRTTRVSSRPPSRGPDGLSPTPSAQASADTSTKRSEMIMLKIPHRGVGIALTSACLVYSSHANKLIRKSPTENSESQTEQQNVTAAPSQQSPTNQSIRVSPGPQRSDNPMNFNATDFEICAHTCNAFPCRNDSQSFLWPRKQPSLPRHVLSTKKHHLCSPLCPGYRLLNMPLADAMKEPRKAKCRAPTEAELALAIEEASKTPPGRRKGEKGTRGDGPAGSEGSGEPEECKEPEECNEPEGGSILEENAEGEEEDQSPRVVIFSALGKRLRTRTADGDGEERSRKLRSRFSLHAKS